MIVQSKKVIVGVVWSFLENMGGLIFKFVLGVILARLLMPSDFGLIGIIMVFFDIANELVQGGFGQAYIQKKETTKQDTATVFYFNLLISIILYFCLWFSAPFIANFYNEPKLIEITRVMAIVVIIDALRVIKIASIMKKINFRKKTIVMLVSILLAGIISIVMALKGYGIWALVCNTLLSRLFNTIGLWIGTEWISIRDLSYKSFKSLFSYGSWLLLSSFLNKFFLNINVLIIGRLFSPAILGFYNTARQYKNMAVGQIFTSVNSVAFPVFSHMQDDIENLKNAMKKFLQQILFITFPVILSLLVVARPFVILLLTEKWSSMIPFLELFCIIGVIFPLNAINVQTIIALGYSRLRFKVIFLMFCLRIINIFIMYRWGVIYILVGEVLMTIIAVFINTYFTKKFLNYGLFKQIKDIKHFIIGGLTATIAGMTIKLMFSNLYVLFLLGIITTVSTFFIYQYFFNRNAFNVLLFLKEKLITKLKGEKTI